MECVKKCIIQNIRLSTLTSECLKSNAAGGMLVKVST